MAEGSSVDDYHDAASAHSICESSESGEIEVHHGPTHIEEEDESKLHSDTEVEAPEGGHGALKETVFKVSQEPGQDSEMVEGNGSDYDHNAALDCSIRESSFIGEIEAHCDSTQEVAEEDKSKIHPGTEGEAEQTVHDILTPVRESQNIDQHLAQDQLASKCSRRGKKRATTAESCEQKKRQRCKNWTDHETEQLVNLKLECLRNEKNVGRFGKNRNNDPVWGYISKKIPERTPKQCQNRWDTVVRSYRTIKSHLDGHNKQFSQVTMKDFQEMETVGPYFRSAQWYKMFSEQREVWDLSLRSQGRRLRDRNAAVVAGTPALLSAGGVNQEASAREVAIRTSSLDHRQPTVTGCEVQPVCFPHNLLQWMMMLAIGLVFSSKKVLLLEWWFFNQS